MMKTHMVDHSNNLCESVASVVEESQEDKRQRFFLLKEQIKILVCLLKKDI